MEGIDNSPVSSTSQKHAELTGRLVDKFRFAVPVFHIFAHNAKCQVEYRQSFCEGTGLIHAETLYVRLRKSRERQEKSKDVIKEVESKWLYATDSLMAKARKLSTERQQLLS